MFRDREDAGEKLARALERFRDRQPLVLGIARGGVTVGYEVASYLDADFSVLVVRKLPFPNNPEAGFGAIAEDGSLFIYEDSVSRLPGDTVDRIVNEQNREIARRVKALRQNKALPRIKDRSVILVDDGIAMGSTMWAAVKMCRKNKAREIMVAAPIADSGAEREFKQKVDDVIILEKPSFFSAVAQGYEEWYDVPDSEVIELMNKWREKTKM